MHGNDMATAGGTAGEAAGCRDCSSHKGLQFSALQDAPALPAQVCIILRQALATSDRLSTSVLRDPQLY